MSVPSLLQDTTTAHAQRRAEILVAARRCFAREGFHGASMGAICAEARMSPGGLYRYFASKEAIIEAIAGDERERVMATVADLFGPAPLFDRLVGVAMGYLRETADEQSGSLMLEICAESARNGVIGERFHEIERAVRSALESALREGQADGVVDPDLDIPVATVVMFSVVDGLLMRLRLDPDFEVASVEPYFRRLVEGLLAPRR